MRKFQITHVQNNCLRFKLIGWKIPVIKLFGLNNIELREVCCIYSTEKANTNMEIKLRKKLPIQYNNAFAIFLSRLDRRILRCLVHLYLSTMNFHRPPAARNNGGSIWRSWTTIWYSGQHLSCRASAQHLWTMSARLLLRLDCGTMHKSSWRLCLLFPPWLNLPLVLCLISCTVEVFLVVFFFFQVPS